MATHNSTVDLPQYNNACDYCLKVKKSNSISCFPLLNKAVVQFIFADMYHGIENKILGTKMTVEVLQKIQQHPDADINYFKASSKTLP